MPEKLAYITVEQFDINLSVSYFYKNNRYPRRSLARRSLDDSIGFKSLIDQSGINRD